MAQVLGIDIGGTGIKGAPVDVASGKLMAERQKLDTPHPAKPDDVAKVVAELVKSFNWTGPVGATFPGVVLDGMVRSAANLDPDWIGVNAADLFGQATGQKFTVINDADAAGLAEMKFGAGAGKTGTVLMLTLGTGIGSALFIDGILVPNSEFGHIEIRGKDAEERDLSWGKWAGRVDEYLEHMERLLSPSLFIIGGGISKKSDKFLPLLTGLQAPVVPAGMLNDAGIVGAAMTVSVPLTAAAGGAVS
jgi:polyphosphate glucokinase